ncbi:MAG: chemotaxis protein CheA [Campylobacterales bacterium]|nr:chemotaxis protein CheA [Campylobacterales bacterium]
MSGEDFKVFFIEEAAELFENIHKDLLISEEAGELDSKIDALFRDVHTLKGGSGSVGLMDFSGYVHHLENFLDSIREKKVNVTGEIISFIMEQVDYLEDLLHEDFSEKVNEDEYSKDLSSLKKQIDIFKGVGGPKVKKQNNDNHNHDELLDIYETLFHELELASEEDEIDSDRLANIFRSVHTLKGSSVFLGLEKYPEYIHSLEDMLDSARDGDIIYSKDVNELVENKIKVSQNILDGELTNTLDSYEFDNLVEELKEDIKDLLAPPEENLAFELFGFDDEEQSQDEEDGYELFFGENQSKKGETKELDSEDDGYELFLGKGKKRKKTPVKKIIEQSGEEEPLVADEPKVPKEEKKNPSLKELNQEEIKVKKSPIKSANNTSTKESKGSEQKNLKNIVSSSSIRVGLDKIDNLMNRVGDLVITKSMLFQYAESIVGTVGDTVIEKLGYLDREMRELQEAVMSVRMVPMESVYSKLPKIVRDLAKKLNKKVKFEHYGDSVEIDKLMVEGLMDPLTHIIRNSLDHGIELPDDRTAKKKRAVGLLKIEAAQESGNIIITISDDGAGINTEKVGQKALESGVVTEEELARMEDSEKAMLIFNAGLSTAEQISDVSGRGVGMDVVMNNITSLGGKIKVETKKDGGSRFIIILPLTLAIMDGLNVLIGKHKLILPLNMIVESLQPYEYMIKKVGEKEEEILMLRNEFIPIIRLHNFFNLEHNAKKLDEGMLIITRVSEMKVALFVDDFLNQEQIVVKSLEKNYRKIKGVSAATIRGDGSIGYILDVVSIVEETKVPKNLASVAA